MYSCTGTSTAVREDSRAMRPGTSWRPGYKIEPCPTISRENFIYFISDVPGNRRKTGASQKNVGFSSTRVQLWPPAVDPCVSGYGSFYTVIYTRFFCTTGRRHTRRFVHLGVRQSAPPYFPVNLLLSKVVY
jgi:hypothetical protein